MNEEKRILSRGRVSSREEMNKTEAAYAEDLEALRLSGEIVRWWFKPFTVRLSNSPRRAAIYSPDFMVLYPDGTTYVDDTKGSKHGHRDAIVRIKCAAEMYPLWIWRLAIKRPAREGGGFEIEVV